jgi:hypothetical protein
MLFFRNPKFCVSQITDVEVDRSETELSDHLKGIADVTTYYKDRLKTICGRNFDGFNVVEELQKILQEYPQLLNEVRVFC